LAAAFKSAELGIERTIDEGHVQYIASWLVVLKGDKTAIFKASQEAINYLNGLYDSSVVSCAVGSSADLDLNVEMA